MKTEYIRVEVSRSESTEIYLKVPEGWRPSGKDYKLIGKAAKETTDDSDWDKHGWEDSVEVQGSRPVDESEARSYDVFDVCAALAAKAAVSVPAPAAPKP